MRTGAQLLGGEVRDPVPAGPRGVVGAAGLHARELQRRARLVHQHRVHLVDDREAERTNPPGAGEEREVQRVVACAVVAQVVPAELKGGHVRHVGRVRRSPLGLLAGPVHAGHLEAELPEDEVRRRPCHLAVLDEEDA